MKGTVILKSGKEFHGVVLWSFQIEGSRRYWRCGKVEPPFKEGDAIEFEADQSGNVDPESIVVGSAAASSTDSIPETARTTAPDVGARMRYQAARADATRLVVAALHTDHLPHSASTAKSKRLGLLEGYVEKVTQELLEQEDRNT